MAGKVSGAWRSLNLTSSAELRLDFTLQAGQSFRWQRNGHDDVDTSVDGECSWTGVFGDRIWTLAQKDERLLYKVHPEPQNCTDVEDCERSLRDYFQLETNLADLYARWSASDDHFRKIASKYRGVRVLRQDPVENLFSFLCSSNNNIKRITGMVESMCRLYGRQLGIVDGNTFHRFPDVQSLASDTVGKCLRAEKFGYRAEFIQKAAAKLVDEHRRTSSASVNQDVNEWLRQLRTVSYEEARRILMTLPGVGPKVADCVCLMSLDKTSVVPVDTHIFKLASHLYLQSPDHATVKSKSLTKKKYEQIGEHFHNVFGEYAGWAHSVLFTSDLSQFQIEKEAQANNVSRKGRGKKSMKDYGDRKSKKSTSS